MDYNINLEDLVYINNASKPFKQNNFMVIGNYLIGVDNIYTCLYKIELDTNFFHFIQNEGFILNKRQLSAFIKSLSMYDKEFKINTDKNNTIVSSSNIPLDIIIDKFISYKCVSMIHKSKEIDSMKRDINNLDIATISDFPDIFHMRKDDGVIKYILNNKYFISLFGGLIPTNANSKVYLDIIDKEKSFIVVYKSIINKFETKVYVEYLKI